MSAAAAMRLTRPLDHREPRTRSETSCFHARCREGGHVSKARAQHEASVGVAEHGNSVLVTVDATNM